MSDESSFRDDEIYRRAGIALDKGRAVEALKVALDLKRRGYRAADFLLGQIFEFGGPSVAIELETAVHHYKRAAYLNRNPASLSSCVRALMKLGRDYPLAYAYLKQLEEFGASADLELAWAWYHETAPAADLQCAREHYVRAALQGRFHGFFGYSRISRVKGQWVRAMACDCIRVAIGPLLFLFLGSKARYTF